MAENHRSSTLSAQSPRRSMALGMTATAIFALHFFHISRLKAAYCITSANRGLSVASMAMIPMVLRFAANVSETRSSASWR